MESSVHTKKDCSWWQWSFDVKSLYKSQVVIGVKSLNMACHSNFSKNDDSVLNIWSNFMIEIFLTISRMIKLGMNDERVNHRK